MSQSLVRFKVLRNLPDCCMFPLILHHSLTEWRSRASDWPLRHADGHL